MRKAVASIATVSFVVWLSWVSAEADSAKPTAAPAPAVDTVDVRNEVALATIADAPGCTTPMPTYKPTAPRTIRCRSLSSSPPTTVQGHHCTMPRPHFPPRDYRKPPPNACR